MSKRALPSTPVGLSPIILDPSMKADLGSAIGHQDSQEGHTIAFNMGYLRGNRKTGIKKSARVSYNVGGFGRCF